ncbi:hypothetical protein Rin_00010810 [Candidatus Regiella insecticola 5.15]|uniref:Uncharacterized protein n=1 Tax=Candidatus Regiella insecticola 5.15 TaxID=1005043 RepID=G2GZ66_9ENTR|nr:hypothetical protein Rin_00010810 [Candidatus Regiella insecticola 5.15]
MKTSLFFGFIRQINSVMPVQDGKHPFSTLLERVSNLFGLSFSFMHTTARTTASPRQ